MIVSIRGYPFFIHGNLLSAGHRPRVLDTLVQAGLLTHGSSYRPHLPDGRLPSVAFLRLSSPITAAGPSPISTGFPFRSL